MLVPTPSVVSTLEPSRTDSHWSHIYRYVTIAQALTHAPRVAVHVNIIDINASEDSVDTTVTSMLLGSAERHLNGIYADAFPVIPNVVVQC